jgi:hypothetical protein
MKLRTGRSEYKIVPVGRVDHAFIEGNQLHNQMYDLMLRQIELRDSANLDFSFQGVPTVFAINPIKNTIKFWPAPNKPYKVRVRYQPPMQEF